MGSLPRADVVGTFGGTRVGGCALLAVFAEGPGDDGGLDGAVVGVGVGDGGGAGGIDGDAVGLAPRVVEGTSSGTDAASVFAKELGLTETISEMAQVSSK